MMRVHQPPAADAPERGVVKFYNAERGYGFVIPDNQSLGELFFHASALNGAVVEKGDKVAYTRGRNSRGPCAERVRLVKAAAEAAEQSA